MADSYHENAEPLYDQAPGAYMHVEPDEVVPTNFDNPLYFQGKKPTADAGYLAVQPDWLSEQWDLLAEQPWFRGFMQRDDAMAELRTKSPGSFVVRVSNSEPGHYAISAVQFNSQMDHMLILPSYAGENTNAPGATRYRLGTYSKLLFNTVPKLIAYYIDHEYIDVRRLQGEVVAENQVGGYMDVNPHAPGWNKATMGRVESEGLLRGEQVGAFVVRTKQGTGFVITQAVPPPKDITHHLVTIKEGDWFIDNVPVGQFRSVDGLVEILMQDTLGVLHCPLIDVFSGGGGQSYADQYGGGGPSYDSAGTHSAANAALYDTAGNSMDDQMGNMSIYDQAGNDANTGYLGVQPNEDGTVGYLGVEPAPAAAQDSTGYLGVEPAPEFENGVDYDQQYGGDSNVDYNQGAPAQFGNGVDYDQGMPPQGGDVPYEENPYGDNGEPYNPYGETGEPYNPYGETGDPGDYEPQNDVEL